MTTNNTDFGVELHQKMSWWEKYKQKRKEKKEESDKKKRQQKLDEEKRNVHVKYTRKSFFGSIYNAGKMIGTIATTASFTAGGVGMVAGLVASFCTIVVLSVILLGNQLAGMKNSWYTYSITISVVLNAIFIGWMFVKREFRYYWGNVRKMYTFMQRGKQFVYALVLFKNQSAVFEVLPVLDGQVEYNKKIYNLVQKGLYRDLRGGWQIVVLEEDNVEIRTFFDGKQLISADALARYMLKVKDWAEIKAKRDEKLLMYAVLAVGLIAAVAAYFAYSTNANYIEQVGRICAQASADAVANYAKVVSTINQAVP